MERDLATLDVRTRAEWHGWLAKHHASSPGIWMVFHKRRGVESILYEDAVREALCFGWIDSLIKRVDDDRYLRKFTPRKPSSKWSALNRTRWAELDAAGLLAASGQQAAPGSRSAGAPSSLFVMDSSLATRLQEHPRAWQFFQTLAPTYRRHFVGWIQSARRPETRDKRIRESIDLLAAGKKLGLK